MRFRNPANGFVEEASMPFLWSLLFGFIYFAVKGIWTHAVVHFVLAVGVGSFSLGIGGLVVWLIYPFFAKSIVRSHYLRRGWQVVDD